jgi:hypothetical protein
MITRRKLIQVAVSVCVTGKAVRVSTQAPSVPTGFKTLPDVELDAIKHHVTVCTQLSEDGSSSMSTADANVPRGMLQCGQRVLIRCEYSNHQIIFVGRVISLTIGLNIPNGVDHVHMVDDAMWAKQRHLCRA